MDESLEEMIDRLKQRMERMDQKPSEPEQDDGPSLEDEIADYEDRATQWIKATLPTSTKEYEHISALPPDVVARRAVAYVVNNYKETGKEIPLLDALKEMEADYAHDVDLIRRAKAAKAKPPPKEEEDLSDLPDKELTRRAVELLRKQGKGWK